MGNNNGMKIVTIVLCKAVLSPLSRHWRYHSLALNYLFGLFLGNNTFGDDIPKLLKDICDTDERNAYILMERICPAPFQGYALRPNTAVQTDTFVSELGIFGMVVG